MDVQHVPFGKCEDQRMFKTEMPFEKTCCSFYVGTLNREKGFLGQAAGDQGKEIVKPHVCMSQLFRCTKSR